METTDITTLTPTEIRAELNNANIIGYDKTTELLDRPWTELARHAPASNWRDFSKWETEGCPKCGSDHVTEHQVTEANAYTHVTNGIADYYDTTYGEYMGASGWSCQRCGHQDW